MRRKINCAVICSVAVLSSLMASSTAMAREVPKWIAVREDEKEAAWEKLAMTYDGVLTGVNVRAQADAESEVVGLIYPGCAVWVIEKGEKWTEISSGEIEGFVDNDYLLYGEDAESIAEKYGCDGVTAVWDGVCVYAEPSGDSEVWDELKTGDDLVLLEDNGHWLTVEYGEDKAYVSEEDVERAFLLDAAYGLDEEYVSDEEETEEYYEEEYYEEEYYEEEDGGEGEEYTDPETSAPQTEAPQTNAPQTEAPQTNAPQTEAPQTNAPQTEAPQTDPPQTEAPQTDPPQTDAPQTDAPQTDDVNIDDEGWYDADTDTYYDKDGNVISKGGNSQADAGTEEDYAQETLPEETAAASPAAEEEVSQTDDGSVSDGGWYDADTDTYYDANGNVISAGGSDQSEEAADINEDDAALLAALIYCEAGGESYDGMTAVGSVVMNRIMNENFPDTVSDVIYQSGQFSPAENGALADALANGVPSECYDAAVAALSGECPAGDVLYFNSGTGEGEIIDGQQFY